MKSGEYSSANSDLYYVKNILKRATLDSQIANMANNINKGLINNKYYSELYTSIEVYNTNEEELIDIEDLIK